jgi:hypothetical protein
MGLPLLILLFCSSGCSFGLLEGYRKSEQADVIPVSWFKTNAEHLLMNTTIDMMKNHFSGIMVIKSIADSGYRVVFLTEVGLKIFDMEFVSGKPAKVYYFMDVLNRKILVKTLSADIKLILMQTEEDRNTVVYENSPGLKMVKYKYNGTTDYYEISTLTGKPVHAYQVSGTSKKARVDYYSRNGMQIDSVSLVHYHIKLRIGMHLINENNQDAVK